MTLYMIHYDGDDAPSLRMEPDKYESSCREAAGEECTTSAIAVMLDHNAENRNCHDFVGLHKKLLEVVCNLLGEEAAHKLALHLAERKGLHGMQEE